MNTFSKNHTQFVKGIAALLLLWHHLFFTQFEMPLNLGNFNVFQLLTCLTKVCVALFTIMSGYGLTISYKHKKVKDSKFVFEHIKKLLINYWWIFIPVFILSFKLHKAGTPVEIYGSGFQGVLNGFLDFSGLRGITYTPTLTNTWWYMGAILVYYLFFPAIYKCCKKLPIISIFVAAIPCIINIFVKFTNTSDRELFYLLPFVVGVVFADREILNKAVDWSNGKKLLSFILSGISVVIAMAIVTQNRLIGNTIYACAIIFACIAVKAFNIKPVNYVAETYGKYSMDIYFAHPFLYSMGTFAIIAQFIHMVPNLILRYVALVVLALVVSIMIEFIKKYFYKLVSKLKMEKTN